MTDDQKMMLLKELTNAYQVLDLYESERSEGRDFGQVAFSLNACAITMLADVFGLESRVKTIMDEKTKENKERNQKITALEQQLGRDFQPESYKEQVRTVFRKIEKQWKKEGFSTVHDRSISQYGDVFVSFSLQPIHEPWDLLDEDEYEHEENEAILLEAFQLRLDVFMKNKLQTAIFSSYLHVLDCDENKKKIESLIKQNFPSVEIEQWKSRRQANGVFTLSMVETRMKNLHFLGENR